jgi:hypothetical protein
MSCAGSTLPLNVELHGADSRGRLLTVAYSINGANAESLGLCTTLRDRAGEQGTGLLPFFRDLCSDALDFRGTNEPAAVKRARVRAVVPAVGNRLLVNANREEHHKAFHSIN